MYAEKPWRSSTASQYHRMTKKSSVPPTACSCPSALRSTVSSRGTNVHGVAEVRFAMHSRDHTSSRLRSGSNVIKIFYLPHIKDSSDNDGERRTNHTRAHARER